VGSAAVAADAAGAGLRDSNAERLRRIESGEQQVIGVNAFTSAAPSPLVDEEGGILVVDEAAEAEQLTRLDAWRAGRDDDAVAAALAELRRVAGTDENLMAASIACARAGVTTGEWSGVLREAFGEYRGPTGVSERALSSGGSLSAKLEEGRRRVRAVEQQLGRKLKILVGKPGLDGHSNGAEQVAIRARDLGMEVIYEGIRLTPAQIVRAAVDEDVHVVGLSILSGSHLALVPQVVEGLRAEGHDVPVVAGPSSRRPTKRSCAQPASQRCSPPRTTNSPTYSSTSPRWPARPSSRRSRRRQHGARRHRRPDVVFRSRCGRASAEAAAASPLPAGKR
jgi:ethylmalonyl-CoA mutase